jgi:hypothetical protein
VQPDFTAILRRRVAFRRRASRHKPRPQSRFPGSAKLRGVFGPFHSGGSTIPALGSHCAIGRISGRGALQEVGLPANACVFSANFLRMDASGKAIVAWGCPGPLDTLPVYYSRFAAGSGWTPQTRVDGPAGSTNGTSLLWGLAANDSGEAVAVWSTDDPNAGLSELALWVTPLP